ncbi:MAG: hypothetical protein IKV32_00140 [Muribaculaceae bacterium]|nr:hypothetical protein [Muribaculaceae bacterium]
MNKYIKVALLSTAAIMSLSAVAQNTNSAYFTEGYTHRYQLNPVYGNDKNFISIPIVGNANTAMRGTIGIENLFYNVDGQTTTFMNPAVDASTFLNGINDMSRLALDANINLMSAGFKAFGGYNTVSINARGNMNSRIPKTLFSFLKEGIENKTYSISDFDVHTDFYGEIALGHSRQLDEKWRIGGTLKFILGGANIDARFNKAELTLGEDAWSAVTNAEVQASVNGLNYTTDINEATGNEYVSGMEIDGFGLNGFGLAIDLGAEFKPNRYWSISASLLDFGYVKWNNNMVASTGGDKSFTTETYNFSLNEKDEHYISDEMDAMIDDISTLYELQDEGNVGSRSTMLGATLNIGAEFVLPTYDRLKFGLLNSTRIQGDYSWTEFRLSANINPVEPLALAANVGVGTYGWSFGWLANVNVTGFNLFVGMDHTPGRLAKQGIPLSSNASVNLGVNIPF